MRCVIMRAASTLFARKGYGGTTTREIAARARINEALLFRHFPSKEKLYWTIIEEQCGARGRRHKIRRLLQAGGSDQEIFSAIAREFLTRSARDTELTRLLWFTALESQASRAGKALGSGFAYPVTLQEAAKWCSGLAGRGYQLVPASAVMARR